MNSKRTKAESRKRVTEQKKARTELEGLVASLTKVAERHKETSKELRLSEKRLQKRSESLQEANIALEVLLRRRDQEKIEFEEEVQANIARMVFPFLDKLKKTKLDNNQIDLVEIIDKNLKRSFTSLDARLLVSLARLTPTEFKVANHVKQGMSTKEIAETMKISRRTVETHRDNIRKKIGIKKKGVNLRKFLLSVL
ncbi:MAG: hypothetical protein KAI75_01935 [Desulfobulbaceae bacterium]|nr:hypothetical protein [Desulfobulbaceae bacterium]